MAWSCEPGFKALDRALRMFMRVLHSNSNPTKLPMKHILKATLFAAALCAVCLPLTPPAAFAAEETFSPAVMAQDGEKGFKVITGTDAVTVNFAAIIPLADTVVAAITFPEKVGLGDKRVTYTGDAELVGKTLKQSVRYPIRGNSITLTSGSCIVLLR